MNFQGIKPEGIMLLAENRFNNSKAFYDEHKKDINELVVSQMRAIVADLSEVLEDINPDFILDTRRCLSRVRRVTRFTNDKSLYRENLWLMFRHQKNELPTPSLWFEFTAEGYTYGCGIISAKPSFMEYWRSSIADNQQPLIDATEQAFKAGLVIDDNRYKRSKAEADGIAHPIIKQWYEQKAPFVIKSGGSLRRLNEPKKLIKELGTAYAALKPLYRYMLDITKRFNSEEV